MLRLALALVLLASTAAAAPRVERGLLSPTSGAAPATIARAHAALRDGVRGGAPLISLATLAVRHLRRGALVEIGQRHAGLSVLGASAAIRIDERGRVRWTRSSLRALPDLPPARLDPAAALAQVAGGPPAAETVAGAREVIWAAAGPVRRAYRAVLPLDRDRLERWDVVVDADRGALLARRNLIERAAGHLAAVFPENPVATPDLEQVSFAELAADASRLSGPDVVATSCVDTRQCVDLFGTPVHLCELAQVATVNGEGDFLDHAMPADPLDATDPFAEVSTYFHVAKAYAAFRAMLGDPGFELEGGPIVAVANARMFGSPCDATGPAPEGSELTPIDNAFFARAGSGLYPGIDGASIFMGQGPSGDFAYDGDIGYHELGHGLVATLAPELGFQLFHPRGVDVTPAGLAEGLPDYLSSAITDDARLGEYIGQAFDPEHGYIRDLENPVRCPEDLVGEGHFDGELIGHALWTIRAALPAADRPAMDAAIVLAIDGMAPSTGFVEMAALVIAELELALGADAAALAETTFAATGLDDCGGFVRAMASGEVHRALFMTGAPVGPTGQIPAAVQFRIELSSELDALPLRAGIVEGSDPSTLVVLVKPGERPIEWDLSVAPDAARAIALLSSDGVTIDQRLEGPWPAGVYHLQVASQQTAGLRDIELGVPASPDAGPSADAGEPAEGEGDGGCGCRTGSPGGVLGGLLLALALARVRRR